MKIAFQIDPISTLNSKTDSTLLIMNGALKRGFEVWFYYPASMLYKDNALYAYGFKFDGSQKEDHNSKSILLLEDFDFIFLRQDPPFNMNYLTTLYLLEKLKNPTILNDPRSVRDFPEKLFVLDFPEFTPPTLISNNEEEIRDFWKKHQEIILKPLYSYGGKGVFYISKEDKNLFNAFRILQENYGKVPVIAQKYIPNVVKGDKRITFINGDFSGAINRIQQKDSAVSNIVSGAKYEQTTLTSKENQMCKTFLPIFKKLGLFLVGIDVIDDYVIEINVTSPTGFVVINELYGIKTEEKILDEMLVL